MKKDDAIALFGNRTRLAEAIYTKSPAITIWPEKLTPLQTIRVVGAAALAGHSVRKLRDLAGKDWDEVA